MICWRNFFKQEIMGSLGTASSNGQLGMKIRASISLCHCRVSHVLFIAGKFHLGFSCYNASHLPTKQWSLLGSTPSTQVNIDTNFYLFFFIRSLFLRALYMYLVVSFVLYNYSAGNTGRIMCWGRKLGQQVQQHQDSTLIRSHW